MLRFDQVTNFFVRPDFFPQFTTRISKFLNSLNCELLTISFRMRPTFIYNFSWVKKNWIRGMKYAAGNRVKCIVTTKIALLSFLNSHYKLWNDSNMNFKLENSNLFCIDFVYPIPILLIISDQKMIFVLLNFVVTP